MDEFCAGARQRMSHIGEDLKLSRRLLESVLYIYRRPIVSQGLVRIRDAVPCI